MREIKFRGKIAKDGKWIEGDLCRWGTDPSDEEYAISYWDEDSGWMNDRVRVDTIGQFTGVLDKEGKKVYEGDIIEWKTTNGTVIRGEVKYHANCASFFINTKGGTRFLTRRRGKVIGNIHDNPELLREEQQ